jgi:hypothetical protein
MMRIEALPTPANPVDVSARPTPAPRSVNPRATVDDMDIVEVWGHDSFPASDPPANW